MRICSRVLAILVLFAVSSSPLANGFETPQKPSPTDKGRKCAQPCLTPCNSAITINCSRSVDTVQPNTGKPGSPTPTPRPGSDDSSQSSTVWWVQLFKEAAGALLKLISALAWPAVIVFVLLYLGRDLLARLIGNVRRVKGGGLEVEFNAERAREVASAFDASYKGFLHAAQVEYDRLVNANDLQNRLLPNAVDAVRRRALRTLEEKSLRATVHVPDVVFKNFMYQLLDYYPPGGGRGRRFSVQFGILGRSWRLVTSLGEGAALQLSSSNAPGVDAYESKITALVTEWGMTRTDAVAALVSRDRESYLCILLVPSKASARAPAGVLYLDARPINTFGDRFAATQLATSLENEPAVKALADAVGHLMERLREEGGAFLDVAVS